MKIIRWDANGIKNRIGLALAASSEKPMIRVEDREWVQGLKGGFVSADGQNYAITQAQKDELIKECNALSKDWTSVALGKEQVQTITEKIGEIIGLVIPSRKGLITLETTDKGAKLFQIRLNGIKDERHTQIIIPSMV